MQWRRLSRQVCDMVDRGNKSRSLEWAAILYGYAICRVAYNKYGFAPASTRSPVFLLLIMFAFQQQFINGLMLLILAKLMMMSYLVSHQATAR